jgi:LysM repeat protein
MNFASRSVKPDLKPQNEDFLFDSETPQGHFFAVLDFSEHDFANLNTTLETKLETIVGSFVSVSNFSADLFLGFVAREINNFLHNLGQQSGESGLVCSAALCLVSGNRLFSLGCGDTRVAVFNPGRTLVFGSKAEQVDLRLGDDAEPSWINCSPQEFPMADDDRVLIMSGGLAGELRTADLSEWISENTSLTSTEICDSFLEASESIQDDRTLVIVGGPYEEWIEPEMPRLSVPVVSQEDEVNTMSESDDTHSIPQSDESGFVGLEARLENLTPIVASKSETDEVIEIQSEVSKPEVGSPDAVVADAVAHNEEIFTPVLAADVAQRTTWSRTLMWGAVILLIGTVGGYLGGWLQASRSRKPIESWSVKTSGSQVLLSRFNEEGSASSILIPVPQPVKASGEQTFSSFADAKQYIDTMAPPRPLVPVEQVVEQAAVVTQPKPKAPIRVAAPAAKAAAKPEPVVSSVAFRKGDTLQGLAQRYNVSTSRLVALNSNISRWSQVKPGQKIVLPAGSPISRPTTARPAPTKEKNAVAKNATVAAGETLDKLASRLKVPPSRLKQLNPQITNWSRIQTGQKVVVSNSSRG